MPSFAWLELGFLGLILALVAERAWVLWWRLPVSDRALQAINGFLRAGDLESARAFARARPRTYVGELLIAHEGGAGEALALVSHDLAYFASVRLLALRVCATLSSTLGLLGAVVALARGLAAPHGLVALEAGLSERLALGEALAVMAIGVSMAAVCFFAQARLRRAAGRVVAQGRSVAHSLSSFEAHPPGARDGVS